MSGTFIAHQYRVWQPRQQQQIQQIAAIGHGFGDSQRRDRTGLIAESPPEVIRRGELTADSFETPQKNFRVRNEFLPGSAPRLRQPIS
jgi:hypothetical protein